MKVNGTLLRVWLCLLLACVLLIALVACGTTSTDGNADDDGGKKPGSYEDDWSGDDQKDPDQAEPSRPSQDDKPGGSITREADMSLVDADKFYIGYSCDPYFDLGFVQDAYLGSYTEGLITARIEFYLGYGDEADGIRWELEHEIDAGASVDSERLTNEVTYLVSAEDMADFRAGYLDCVSESSLRSALENMIEDIADGEPTRDQMDTFMADVFGYGEFTELVESSFPEGITLGTAEEIGFDEFGDRDPVEVRLRIEGPEDWGRFVYADVMPFSLFDSQVEIGTYYYRDDEQTVYYDFKITEHLDAFQGLGLTITDEGILVDDAFFDVLNQDYATDKKGVIVLVETAIDDGTVQPVELEVCTSSTPRIWYEIDVPETVAAEPNFEEGFAVSFTVTLAGKAHTVTVDDLTYQTKLQPSSYIGQISDWLRRQGELRGSSSQYDTALIPTAPDAVTYTAAGIPVSEHTFLNNLKQSGSFVLTYGDRTTVLGPETEGQLGIHFTTMVDKLTAYNDGDSRSLLLHMIYGGYTASPTPYSIACYVQLDSMEDEIPVTVSLQLDSYIAYLELANANCIGTEYYIGDAVSIVPGSTVNLMRQTAFRGAPTLDSAIPLTADMIEGFDSSAEGSNLTMQVVYNGHGTNLITYAVRRDFVTSIEVSAPWFTTYIVGTRAELEDATIKAYYESGKTDTVALTAEHLSALPTETGNFDITVTYEGKTATLNVDALKVASATVYEGLGAYYLVGEKPTEATVRVEFEANSMGYDYDYVIIGEPELATFDTATAGSKSWVYTWAGVEISHSYSVVAKAYVSYTSNGEAITINGIVLDQAPETYYEITSFTELVIPAEIDGVPVTAIAANAFKNKNMITKITLPESIVSIGSYAFQNATGLAELNIPQSVTAIGTKILSGCTGLAKLYISGDTPISKYFGETLPTALTVYVNEGEDTLCSRFLLDLGENDIAKVVLPATLTTITLDSETVFWSLGEFDNILAFDANPGGYYTAADGVLFANYGKELLFYPEGKTTEHYTVPDGVERVTYMAYNKYLKSVTIPATVTELGDSVFMRDEALTTVTFLGSLAALPDNCFSGCESLANFSFPAGVTSIGDGCFEYTVIPTIVIPKGVTYVGSFAFYQCKVQKLAVPASAMESFCALGDQLMTALTEFAYDGSVPLKEINAIYYNYKLNSPISKVYIYDTTTFAGGIGNATYTQMTVYIDKCVTSMTYNGTDQHSTYRYEGSSLSNSSGLSVSAGATFTKWYLS